MKIDLMKGWLRAQRNSAARRGDNAIALILNDRIADLKSGSDLAVRMVMREYGPRMCDSAAPGQPASSPDALQSSDQGSDKTACPAGLDRRRGAQ